MFALVPIDIVMILLAFAMAFFARSNLELQPIQLDVYLRYAVFLLPVWLLFLAVSGLYSIKNNGSFLNEIVKIINASASTMLILIVLLFLAHNSIISRLILVLTWFFSVLTISFGRLLIKIIQRRLTKYGIGVRNLLLLGDNIVTEKIVTELSNNSFGYNVLGILNSEGETSRFGSRVVGSIHDFEKKIKEMEVNEVVTTDTTLPKKRILEIIQICSDNNIAFKFIPDVFSVMSLNFHSGLIGSMPVMELRNIPLEGWGRIIKRLLDIIFSAIFLIVFSPIFLIISTLIKVTSKGPVIYTNKRVGRDGKPFDFYKFRSMYLEHCDFTDGTNWTTKDDEKIRITPIGKLLRKTNLDELPQLWNILVGDMSFVGPRPEFPRIVEKFEKEIPDYFRRHRVKAGLTGWAQVHGLKGDTSVKERVRYDIYYIENWSLWLDLKIIIRTFGLVMYETFAGKYEYRSRP